jgi:hypothetical protein
MVIPKPLYEIVRQRAKFRCEYCHYLELLSSSPLSIDHIHPQSLGGSDDLDNLALACRRCNERRYNFTTGIDPETGVEVPLFNPRQQTWSEHFIWSADALKIVGKTSSGRATCNRRCGDRPFRYLRSCCLFYRFCRTHWRHDNCNRGQPWKGSDRFIDQKLLLDLKDAKLQFLNGR